MIASRRPSRWPAPSRSRQRPGPVVARIEDDLQSVGQRPDRERPGDVLDHAGAPSIGNQMLEMNISGRMSS